MPDSIEYCDLSYISISVAINFRAYYINDINLIKQKKANTYRQTTS